MTVGPDYFDRMYGDDPDPWGFGSQWYERRKYAVTLASLPRERYRRVFEPGCSIGVLTEQLALRVDELVAWDLHADTVRRAEERTGHLSHVTVEEASIPDRWPDGSFDLIVLSEVAYYLDDDALATLGRQVANALSTGGDLVAVHYSGKTDYPKTADAVHAALGGADGFEALVSHRDEAFLLDVWRRT